MRTDKRTGLQHRAKSNDRRESFIGKLSNGGQKRNKVLSQSICEQARYDKIADRNMADH